jgi:hypothetical protein
MFIWTSLECRLHFSQGLVGQLPNRKTAQTAAGVFWSEFDWAAIEAVRARAAPHMKLREAQCNSPKWWFGRRRRHAGNYGIETYRWSYHSARPKLTSGANASPTKSAPAPFRGFPDIGTRCPSIFHAIDSFFSTPCRTLVALVRNTAINYGGDYMIQLLAIALPIFSLGFCAGYGVRALNSQLRRLHSSH